MLLDDILAAVDLDIAYVRGVGDHLITEDGREVLDLVQGAGTGLFGHNHPELVGALEAALAEQVPQQAQFSIRPGARRLIKRLSALLADDPEAFVGVLTNSGTETTEAALKHALLEYRARLQTAAHSEPLRPPTSRRAAPIDVPATLARELGLDPASSSHSTVAVAAAIEARNASVLALRPRFLALRHGFHGKSLGALRVTFAERYRLPFLEEEETARFVDVRDPDGLRSAFDEAMCRLYRLQPGRGGRLQIATQDVSGIAGFVYEPIQGEAGIYPVPADFIRLASALSRERNIPLIADEVQTFARTGDLLASRALGVDPDYVLLAKGIGGGLCKLGALLVRRHRYQAAFSRLHSSTFAYDEVSSRVALRVLDLLTREDGAVLGNARQKGEQLLGRLRALQARYSDAIADIRGRGLMIGIEFRALSESPAWGLAMVGRASGWPALDLCSYLLHETGVRTLPTLSQLNTIRIEPPLTIDDSILDRTVAAVEQLARVLSLGDSAAFLRHKLTGSRPGTALRPAVPAAKGVDPPPGGSTQRRAAFLCHPIHARALRTIDSSLSALKLDELERLLVRYEEVITPHILGQSTIRSTQGEDVVVFFICLPYTSRRLAELLRRRDLRSARAKIQEAVNMAAELGCTVCGLGQYSSIVTRNGLAVKHDRLVLTTGNALTVGTALAATLERARRRHCFGAARVAVVGAAGNIGSILAALLADHFTHIKLIGSDRRGSRARLERTAHRMFERAWRLRLAAGGTASQGLAAAPALARLFAAAPDNAAAPGESLYRAAVAQLGEAVPVSLHDQLALNDCDLIFCAANAPEAIVYPEHLQDSAAIVCDLGLPHNVSAWVTAACPDVELVRSAIALPHGENVGVLDGFMPAGQIFPCVAETLLLALDGRTGHFSYGDISCEQVADIQQLALRHGFCVSALQPARGAVRRASTIVAA
jgi:acetylornithine/succinyldiaminopimelate/putrescine aminotransferase/predicted amino acid dehydrogenase